MIYPKISAALTLSLLALYLSLSLPVLCQDCDVFCSDEGFGCSGDRVIKGIDCSAGRRIAMCVQYTLTDSHARTVFQEIHHFHSISQTFEITVLNVLTQSNINPICNEKHELTTGDRITHCQGGKFI